MKFRYFFSIPLALCLMAFSASAADAAARAAVVDDLRGNVSATQNENEFPAFRGLALLSDDSIETGADSWSRLELNEGQFAVIEENTEIQIIELAEGVGSGAGTTRVYLSEGKVWFDVSKELSEGESFEVKTPTVAFTVRGTFFSVEVGGDGKTTLVVYQGMVTVRAETRDGRAILDGDGNEVAAEVTEGKAEISAEDGTVSDFASGGISQEDMAPLVQAGDEGPGGVYNVLREQMDEPMREIIQEMDRTQELQTVIEEMSQSELLQVMELLGDGGASPQTLLDGHSLNSMTEGDKFQTPNSVSAEIIGSLWAGAGNDGTYSFDVNLGTGIISSAAMSGHYGGIITYNLSGGTGNIINGNNFIVDSFATGSLTGNNGPYSGVDGRFGGIAAYGFDNFGDIGASGWFEVLFTDAHGNSVIKGDITDGRRVR